MDEPITDGLLTTDMIVSPFKYYRSECFHGAFSRTIRLPKGINADDARASFSNGVLEVTLPAPKHPEKHGRRVEIE